MSSPNPLIAYDLTLPQFEALWPSLEKLWTFDVNGIDIISYEEAREWAATGQLLLAIISPHQNPDHDGEEEESATHFLTPSLIKDVKVVGSCRKILTHEGSRTSKVLKSLKMWDIAVNTSPEIPSNVQLHSFIFNNGRMQMTKRGRKAIGTFTSGKDLLYFVGSSFVAKDYRKTDVSFRLLVPRTTDLDKCSFPVLNTRKVFLNFTTGLGKVGQQRARINFSLFKLGCEQMAEMSGLNLLGITGIYWETNSLSFSGENALFWIAQAEFGEEIKARL